MALYISSSASKAKKHGSIISAAASGEEIMAASHNVAYGDEQHQRQAARIYTNASAQRRHSA